MVNKVALLHLLLERVADMDFDDSELKDLGVDPESALPIHEVRKALIDTIAIVSDAVRAAKKGD